MRKLVIIVSLIMCAFGALSQRAVITDNTGHTVTGFVRATLLVYSQHDGGELVWTGTTDGSLPALRLENGYIHNIDNILPGYVRDRGELWIEVIIDGRPVTDGRIRYTSPRDRSLRRDTPPEPGETSETLEDELQIGLPGHELYVASATTGFGVETPVEKVDIDGAIGLKERVAPTPTTDFGKVYVDDSDGHLYFMDDGGTATDLLETSASGGGGTFLAAFEENMLHTCIGEDLWLDVHLAKGTDPYTHLWTGDTGPLSATDIPNPVFNASTAGLYQLTYTITDGDGNSSEYLTYVRVHPDPTPSVTSRPVAGGCVGAWAGGKP